MGQLRDQSGMTLIEMLVAMVLGLVIASAALGLVEMTQRTFERVTDQVTSTQGGRTAISRIEQELEYSCFLPATNSDGVQTFWPIQAASSFLGTPASDGSTIVFFSASGWGSPPTITLHKIVYTAASGSTPGTIVDYATPPTASSGGTPTTFQGGTTTATTLATNVSTVGSYPVFQYFGYNGSDELPTLSQLSSTTPLAVPLTANSSGTAADAAAVWINFSVAGAQGDSTTVSDHQSNAYNASELVVLKDSLIVSTATTPYPCS
jgi:type IV pilus assembly protein PilW